MMRMRIKPWDLKRACKKTPRCKSPDGHYGRCLVLVDGRLRFLDEERDDEESNGRD